MVQRFPVQPLTSATFSDITVAFYWTWLRYGIDRILVPRERLILKMRIKAALSSEKRQLRCRGKTSSIPPVFRQKSGKCWAKHLKPCPLCQGCSHPRGSATSVLCLPRQLLYLFSFSLWEKIFFFFYSAWGTALRNADLFISTPSVGGFAGQTCFPELNQGQTLSAA